MVNLKLEFCLLIFLALFSVAPGTLEESCYKTNLPQDLDKVFSFDKKFPFLASRNRTHAEHAINFYSLIYRHQKIGIEEFRFLKDWRVLELVDVHFGVALFHDPSHLLALNLESSKVGGNIVGSFSSFL